MNDRHRNQGEPGHFVVPNSGTDSGMTSRAYNLTVSQGQIGFTLLSQENPALTALRARQQDALQRAEEYRREHGDPIDDLGNILNVDERARAILHEEIDR